MKNQEFRLSSRLPSDHRPETFLKAKDIASLLGVRTSTVTRWLRSGILPAVKLSNSGGWRVRYGDWEAWLELHRKDTVANLASGSAGSASDSWTMAKERDNG
jgi:excisionase family DNA binding protein